MQIFAQGLRLHVIVDSLNELTVDYRLATATDGETAVLAKMLEEPNESHPEMLESTEQLNTDRGLGAKELYRALLDDYQ